MMGKGRAAAITVLVVLLVGAVGAFAYRAAILGDRTLASASADASEQAYGKFTALAERRPAPDVEFTARSGERLRLSAFRGKIVLLNLWATWCVPCVKEMPSLDRLQARLGKDLTILAVSEDRKGGAVVEPFLAEHKLEALATYYDPPSALLQAFDAAGLPTTFLIDRNGGVIGRLEGGADWDSPDMVSILRPYLAPDPVQKASLAR